MEGATQRKLSALMEATASVESESGSAGACADGSPGEGAAAIAATASGKTTASGEGEASECSICKAALGKRHLNPRQQCRLCSRTVCTACSPNMLQLPGSKNPQRTCNPCVAIIHQAPAWKSRALQLGDRMASLHTSQLTFDQRQDVEEALDFCESQVDLIQQEREAAKDRVGGADVSLSSERRARQELEARISTAKGVALQVAERLSDLCGPRTEGMASRDALEDGLEACKAAVGPLAQLISDLQEEREALQGQVDRAELGAEEQHSAREDLEAIQRTALEACAGLARKLHSLAGSQWSKRNVQITSLGEGFSLCEDAIAMLTQLQEERNAAEAEAIEARDQLAVALASSLELARLLRAELPAQQGGSRGAPPPLAEVLLRCRAAVAEPPSVPEVAFPLAMADQTPREQPQEREANTCARRCTVM